MTISRQLALEAFAAGVRELYAQARDVPYLGVLPQLERLLVRLDGGTAVPSLLRQIEAERGVLRAAVDAKARAEQLAANARQEIGRLKRDRRLGVRPPARPDGPTFEPGVDLPRRGLAGAAAELTAPAGTDQGD